MGIENILDILVEPISKEKLKIDKNFLRAKEEKYEFDKNFLSIIPKTIRENNYVEHYEQDAEYFDYFQERICKATEDDERRLRSVILSKFSSKQLESKIVLDIGSGSGWLAMELIEKCAKFISIDISRDNLKKLSKIVNSNKLFTIQADALNLPFADNSIDYIVAAEVIEHLVKPKDFIEEIYRVLKPNGKLIISTPYKEKLCYNLCIHCNRPTPQNAHLHSFDENILTKLADNCKNSQIKYSIFGNKLLHLGRSYIILKYLPLKMWLLVDKFFNLLINKKEHIVMEIGKE